MSVPRFLPWAIAALSLAYAATLRLEQRRCTPDPEACAELVAPRAEVSTIDDRSDRAAR